MATKISARELALATLARQMLLQREEVSPLLAIEKLVGMQAQRPEPPFVGLWSRLAHFERADLNKLVRDKLAVRATSLRATIHLTSTADCLAMRPLIQPVLTQAMVSTLRERAKALDVPALVNEARAFFDEEPRTLDELRDFLIAKHAAPSIMAGGPGAHPAADERAMGYAVKMHLDTVLVPTDATFGYPPDADYAVIGTFLGAKAKSKDPAPKTMTAADLVVRYLRAFGPATPADMQSWSGLRKLAPVFESIREQLVVLEDERGREFFDLPDAPRPPAETHAPVRFLPEFDNLVLAHDDRSRLIDTEHRSLVTSKNLQVAATFIVDGRISGTWKLTRKKTVGTVVLSPFVKLKKGDMSDLERESLALAAFAMPESAKHAVSIEGT